MLYFNMQTTANDRNTVKIWRKENRSNETLSTVSIWSLWFFVLKHLYKAFSSLPSFSASLYTLLYHMNYDLPSGNHEKAILFYIHHTIILSISYCMAPKITICFNKDEIKYWEWSSVEKQDGTCLLVCYHFNVFLIRLKWCQ